MANREFRPLRSPRLTPNHGDCVHLPIDDGHFHTGLFPGHLTDCLRRTVRNGSVFCVSLFLVFLGGCAAVPIERAFSDWQAHVNTTLTGIESEVNAVKELNVGGGGDSVTAWLYAAIAGASLMYPLVLRPARKILFKDAVCRRLETIEEHIVNGSKIS